MFGLSLDSWNNVIVGFLAIGASAAVIVGVATYVVFQLQKQEAKDASDALDRYKVSVAAQECREGIAPAPSHARYRRACRPVAVDGATMA